MSLDLAKIDATVVDHAPPAIRVRPHAQLIASAVYSGVAVLALLTLIGVYVGARHTALAAGDTWIAQGGLPLTGPNIALFTLLLSIPAMAWAQQAIRADDRQSLWVSFAVVLLLGAAFINAEAFVLRSLNVTGDADAGVGISDNTAMLLIFTIIGVHIAMVAAGLVSVLVTAFRALGGRMDRVDRDAVDAVALYWYVTIALFGILWYAVLVMK